MLFKLVELIITNFNINVVESNITNYTLNALMKLYYFN